MQSRVSYVFIIYGVNTKNPLLLSILYKGLSLYYFFHFIDKRLNIDIIC